MHCLQAEQKQVNRHHGPNNTTYNDLVVKSQRQVTVKRIPLSHSTIKQSNNGHMHGGLEENLGQKN